MMTEEMASRQAQFSAACLLGRPLERPVTAGDVAWWRDRQLLLPVAEALERAGRGPLPDVMAAEVLASRRVAAAAEAAERHAILRTLEALGAASIPALLLKGVALAYTVYPKPWLRARSDIDMLVPEGSLDRIQDAMRSLGFAPAREVTHPLISRQRHFHRIAGYPVAVDIHDALVNPPVLRTLPTFDKLWARSQPVPAVGTGARALGTADALLHALVHRVAHHNSSVDLLWLYDLHLLAKQMHDRDWELFVGVAQRARVAEIAHDGLRELTAIMQVDLPRQSFDVLAHVRGEPSAALLGGQLTEWRLQWINFKSLRTARERVAFVRAHLLPPRAELCVNEPVAMDASRSYVRRVVRGLPKWLKPISRAR